LRNEFLNLDPEKKGTHFSELLKKGAVVFLLRVGGAGLTFVFMVYLARHLGPADYGLFTLALTVVTMLSVVVRMGLDSVVVRHVAAAIERGNRELAKGYFQAAIRIVVVVGVALSLLGMSFSPIIAHKFFDKPQLVEPLRLLMWLLLPFSVVLLIAEALKGIEKFAESTILQSILIPLFCLVILVAVEHWSAWSLLDAIKIYILSALSAAIYAWLRWRSQFPDAAVIRPRPNDLLREGIPLLLATSSGLVMFWADTLVIGIFCSADMLGIYTVASKTALLTSFILFAVNAVAAQKYSAFYAAGDFKGMKHLAHQTTMLMTGLIILPTIVLLFFPGRILQLFGPEYSTGAAVLVTLVIGQFFNVACGSVGYLLIMSGHEKIVRNIMFVSAIINVALNLLLVQRNGIEGVAVATAMSVIFWNAWMLMAVKKHLGFWTISVPIKIRKKAESFGSDR